MRQVITLLIDYGRRRHVDITRLMMACLETHLRRERVRFALQELGRRGQEEPRRKAGELELSTADNSECAYLPAQNTRIQCRNASP